MRITSAVAANVISPSLRCNRFSDNRLLPDQEREMLATTREFHKFVSPMPARPPSSPSFFQWLRAWLPAAMRTLADFHFLQRSGAITNRKLALLLERCWLSAV